MPRERTINPSRNGRQVAPSPPQAPPRPPVPPPPPDLPEATRQRFRTVRRFFARTTLHLLWWDVLLALPPLRGLRRPPVPRWKAIAREFRALAIECGGVLTKLGQFLSIRVDLLPRDVLNELKDMQDEMPPVALELITAQIERDFQRPLEQVFASFTPQPLGSASLAQVHLARLWSGEEVAVKVLRPGIAALIQADLDAVALAVRWLKMAPTVRQQYDLDHLIAEFISITYQELDMVAEGQNVERFAADFHDDPQVYLPKIYWELTSEHILTMENVSYIRVGNLARLDAAGISRSKVAHKLYEIYMRQFFVTSFVHADPHPGNVFVRPLPTSDEQRAGVQCFDPRDTVPFRPDRPFQLVLIDFGMVTTVPEAMRAGMRDYAIGIGLRDARRVVQSYVRGGLLPPDADLERLEAAHQAIFDQLGGGYLLGNLNGINLQQIEALTREHRTLSSAPMQFRADMIFVFRAMGVLGGITTYLDPDFDAGAATRPFAEHLLRETWQDDLREHVSGAVDLTRLVLSVPVRLGRLLEQAQQGELPLRATLSTTDQQALRRLDQSVNRLTMIVITVGALLGGVIWRAGSAIAHQLAENKRP